jgi:hypothetical protein
MRSVRALLEGLIDYAGLFPPASLDMAAAVRNYASYRDGEHSWMLGRFILPAARLSEFDDAVAGLRGPWRLSCVGQAILPAAGFPAGSTRSVESIELKIENSQDIRPAAIPTYFETPADCIPHLAAVGARSKIRTGGLTAGMFPSSADLARFLSICAAAKVPLKATAGLHHPIRSVHPFTYEPDSPSGMMHGFLNVFLAAALLYSGGSENDAVETLEETSPGAFLFDEESVNWHSHRLSTEQLRAARKNFAIGFGSCSFEEPIADLKAIGVL